MNPKDKDPNRVWKITTMKKPRKKEAKEILHTIARAVQPIMSRHKWRVELLAEYYPDNPCEYGVNIGRLQVKLRLRKPECEIDFFPFDQILDNMLHELCHYDHEAHDSCFYNHMEQLRKEWKELVANGIPGERRHLGGISRPLPSEPRRLGGNRTIMKAFGPLEAAAAAAERRTLRVHNWCGYVPCENAKDGKGSSDKPHDQARTNSSVVLFNSSIHVPDSSVLVSDLTTPKRSPELSYSSVQFLDGFKLQDYLFPMKVLIGVIMFELVWESYKYLFG